MKRALMFLVFASLVAASTAHADPTNTIQLHLSGPGNGVLGTSETYEARLTVKGIAGIPDQLVTFYLNGSTVGTATTGQQGEALVTLPFTSTGWHSLIAQAYRGTPLETTSHTMNIFVEALSDVRVDLQLDESPKKVGVTFQMVTVINNAGPSPATGVQSFLALSGSAQLVQLGQPGACSEAPGGATCSVASISSGGARTFLFHVMAASLSDFQASVTVSATEDDPNGSNNFDHVTLSVFPPAPAGVVINEVDYDQPGADNQEFIEIRGPAGTSLTGVSVVLINGFGSAEYGRHDLDGLTIGSSGYVVLKSASLAASCGSKNLPSSEAVQNGGPGGDGVALYYRPDKELIDAITYDGSITTSIDGKTFNLVSGAPNPYRDAGFNAIGRLPDGVDTGNDASDWRQTSPTPCGANAPLPQ